MKTWLEIISELFVNLSAGWFAFGFIEPLLTDTFTTKTALWLILRLLAGIVSLAIAKKLRDEAKLT